MESQLQTCLCSSKFNFRHCQPHKCSLCQPHLCHHNLQPCPGWCHLHQRHSRWIAHCRFISTTCLLQSCRQCKKKMKTSLDQNSKGWTLEDIRYLRSIRNSIRLSKAIQNPSTPRWIPTNPLELELIKSLEWLLRNWPFHLQVLNDQGHLRYCHPGSLLEHLRSQGLLTHLLPCYLELRSQVHLQSKPDRCARS